MIAGMLNGWWCWPGRVQYVNPVKQCRPQIMHAFWAIAAFFCSCFFFSSPTCSVWLRHSPQLQQWPHHYLLLLQPHPVFSSSFSISASMSDIRLSDSAEKQSQRLIAPNCHKWPSTSLNLRFDCRFQSLSALPSWLCSGWSLLFLGVLFINVIDSLLLLFDQWLFFRGTHFSQLKGALKPQLQ